MLGYKVSWYEIVRLCQVGQQSSICTNHKIAGMIGWVPSLSSERERGITIVADETSGRRYEKVAQNAKI